ncbi:MAG: rhodanese-like domain-containing protein [Cytophagales bacterium]|nr:rhodanese-like domain-containing protein [Cytophagales bacterium]
MNKLAKWIFLPACILIFYFATNAQSDYERITVRELRKEIKKNQPAGYILLDVRTSAEFEQGKMPNAVNIDWYSESFKEKVRQLPKEKTIFVYCRSGRRSSKAVRAMQQLGFEHVMNVEGGLRAWQRA